MSQVLAQISDYVMLFAATMLCRPEPPDWRVEPTTLGVTAIEHPNSTM